VWSIRMPVFLCLFVLSCLICNSGQAALQPGASQPILLSAQQDQDLHRNLAEKLPAIVAKYSELGTDYTAKCQDIFKQFTAAPWFHESLHIVDQLIKQGIDMNKDMIDYIVTPQDLPSGVERCFDIMNLDQALRNTKRKGLKGFSAQKDFHDLTIAVIKEDINMYKTLQELLKSFGGKLRSNNFIEAFQTFSAFEIKIAQEINREFVRYPKFQKEAIAMNVDKLCFSEFPRLLFITSLLTPYQLPVMRILIYPQLIAVNSLAYDFHRHLNWDLGTCIDFITEHFKTLNQQAKQEVLPKILMIKQYQKCHEDGHKLVGSSHDSVASKVPLTVQINRAWNHLVIIDSLINAKLLLHALTQNPNFSDVLARIAQGELGDKDTILLQTVKNLATFNAMVQRVVDEIKTGFAELSLRRQASEAKNAALQSLESKGERSSPVPANELSGTMVESKTVQEDNAKPDLDPAAAPLGLSENNNNPQKLEVVPEKAIQIKPSIPEDIIRLIKGWKWIFKAEEMVRDIFTFKAKIDFQAFCGFLQACGFTVEIDKGGSHGKVTIPKGQSVVYDPASRTLITHGFGATSFPVVRDHGGDKNGKASQLSKLFARQFLSNIAMTPTDIERLEGFVKANKVFGSHAPLTK
jgi:hypothetical protein